MNGYSNFLWTPDNMVHNDVQDIAVHHQNETATAVIYKFEFHYKERTHMVQVVAHSDVTRSEIEDRAGEAAENWMKQIDEEDRKRPPTEDEKKQIGKALNEFYLHAKKRRESSSGRLYFPGVN
jgi:hypothetical protein|tara:strand:+ start:27 stop:395 length:369 start_codon:yes stop_codon:yes gene_type:complete